MKNFRIEAIILAVGLLLLGVFIEKGFSKFAEKDRSVTVKGLAEMEVPANKVTWPLVYKSLGNDLGRLYDDIKRSNQTITGFLKEKGLTEQEISINAPEIIDLAAERYTNNPTPANRYNVTTVITVTSDKVDLIRGLISEQGELLKRGIAITSGEYQYRVQYEYTDLNKVKPQMIEEATKNAREAAEKFAKDSGSQLGKIRQANQGQFSITDRDPNTPYIKKIRVVTTIDYSLENSKNPKSGKRIPLRAVSRIFCFSFCRKKTTKYFNIQYFIIPLQPIYINNIKSNTISYLNNNFLFNGKLKEHCSY